MVATLHWPLAAPAAQIKCKICSNLALEYGQCDINQGGPPHTVVRPELGQALHYHQCTQCGFMFTSQLDHWQAQDFIQHIYNEQYLEVDPDYTDLRPRSQADMLMPSLASVPADFCMLDYGAGNGVLAQLLRQKGVDADSEDPYSQLAHVKPSTLRLYDLVCAFEVLEHSPDPLQTLSLMRSRLKEDGRMLISTLLQPDNIADLRCKWWYCAPRNGHISLFTRAALSLALGVVGAKQTHSFSESLHLAIF